MITVALIDDHLIVRSGFAQLLGLEPDLQVVAEFGSGREALAGLQRQIAMTSSPVLRRKPHQLSLRIKTPTPLATL